MERINTHIKSGLLVSSLGKVYIPPRNAGRRGIAPGYWTTGNIANTGYCRVKYKGITYSVHTLVAETFIQNTENKPTVDHINRVKTDNRVENLRWATQKEQIENGVALKRFDYGVRKCEDRNAYERARRRYKKEFGS